MISDDSVAAQNVSNSNQDEQVKIFKRAIAKDNSKIQEIHAYIDTLKSQLKLTSLKLMADADLIDDKVNDLQDQVVK